MGFLESLFRKQKRKESIILIDAAAESVGGAYGVYAEGEPPVIAYGKRVPVSPRENEQPEHALLRALEHLGHTLLTEGAPALARETGTGRADGIAVALNAPWQKSVIRTERFEKGEPFIFTHDLVREAAKEDGKKAPGKLLIEEHVVSVALNGYKTDDPFGKKAVRADLVVLASLMDERIARHVTADLRRLFHTEQFQVLPGSGIRFEATHAAFPHQEDALILDATSHEPSIGLIRDGMPVAIEDMPRAAARHSWTAPLSHVLGDFSKKYPLPRTVFLLSGCSACEEFQKSFSMPPVRKHWLTHEPPRIIVIDPGHLSSQVRLSAGVEPDLRLILMALYHQAGD